MEPKIKFHLKRPNLTNVIKESKTECSEILGMDEGVEIVKANAKLLSIEN